MRFLKGRFAFGKNIFPILAFKEFIERVPAKFGAAKVFYNLTFA